MGGIFRLKLGEALVFAPQYFIPRFFSDHKEEHSVSWKAARAGSGLASVARELAGQESVFQVLSALPEASVSNCNDPANTWHA